MTTRRSLPGSVLLALFCLLALPSVSHAGLFSKSPKTPLLLGSHPSDDARNARNALLKERRNSVRSTRIKPARTVTSQRRNTGKTVLGQPVKH